MRQSVRAKRNMTNQLRAQLRFLQNDLEAERKALKKAKLFQKWNLPGTETMIRRHENGVKVTLRDTAKLKIRILKRQKNGEIFRII